MTTILAHIEIQPGREAQWEEIMQDMVAKTFAEETGVLRYEYFKGQQPNHYYCLLSFVDKWAFYRHQNSDHHQGHDFAAVLKSIELEYLDPVATASPLPATLDPPLPEEAPEPIKRAQQLYPSQIADWWADRK